MIKYCTSPLENKILILIIDDWFDKSVITKKISLLAEVVNVQTPFESEMKLWAKFFKKENFAVDSDVINLVANIAGDSLAHLKMKSRRSVFGLMIKQKSLREMLKFFSAGSAKGFGGSF